MSIGLRPAPQVPSGMLGAQQWYTDPAKQLLLQMERQSMLPFVGKPVWGVNCGTLPDGRMFWRVRQPIKAERTSGRGCLYDTVYNILLVYEPDHPKGKWGTSVHAYLEGEHDLNWLQSRVNASPRTPKSIPHTLPDGVGGRYLCTSRYDQFGESFDDEKGVATAKTALLCAIRWLHIFECALLNRKLWAEFQQEGKV